MRMAISSMIMFTVIIILFFFYFTMPTIRMRMTAMAFTTAACTWH